MKTTKTKTAAAEKVVAALSAAVDDPGTQSNKAAAEAIVALRRLFRHQDLPDWAGRSGEYRDCIERLYRQAGVPSDSGSNMQANLRYHVGNVLREVAPPEELTALGMAVNGPLSRLRANRLDGSSTRGRIARPGAGDPAALASLALDALRTMRTMEPGPEVAPALRKIMGEVASALQDLPSSN